MDSRITVDAQPPRRTPPTRLLIAIGLVLAGIVYFALPESSDPENPVAGTEERSAIGGEGIQESAFGPNAELISIALETHDSREWTQMPLPADLDVIMAIGVLDGRLAVVGGTLQRHLQFEDVTYAEWDGEAWVDRQALGGPGEVFVDAVIGSDAAIVITRDGAGRPLQGERAWIAGDVTAWTAVGGAAFDRHALERATSDAGALQISHVGLSGTVAWIFGREDPNSWERVLDGVPNALRELRARGLGDLHLARDGVTASALGVDLTDSYPLSDLGVTRDDLVRLPGQAVAWSADLAAGSIATEPDPFGLEAAVTVVSGGIRGITAAGHLEGRPVQWHLRGDVWVESPVPAWSVPGSRYDARVVALPAGDGRLQVTEVASGTSSVIDAGIGLWPVLQANAGNQDNAITFALLVGEGFDTPFVELPVARVSLGEMVLEVSEGDLALYLDGELHATARQLEGGSLPGIEVGVIEHSLTLTPATGYGTLSVPFDELDLPVFLLTPDRPAAVLTQLVDGAWDIHVFGDAWGSPTALYTERHTTYVALGPGLPESPMAPTLWKGSP